MDTHTLARTIKHTRTHSHTCTTHPHAHPNIANGRIYAETPLVNPTKMVVPRHTRILNIVRCYYGSTNKSTLRSRPHLKKVADLILKFFCASLIELWAIYLNNQKRQQSDFRPTLLGNLLPINPKPPPPIYRSRPYSVAPHPDGLIHPQSNLSLQI